MEKLNIVNYTTIKKVSSSSGAEILKEFKEAGVYCFNEVLEVIKKYEFETSEMKHFKDKDIKEDLKNILALRQYLNKSNKFNNTKSVVLGFSSELGEDYLTLEYSGKELNLFIVEDK